jgi:3-methyl-2-oxobutanoate hydroxymethyltransferase
MAQADRVTTQTLQKMKMRGEKIAVVTAYDVTMARLLDQAGVDVLLVGDTLGMVVQGNETTLPVTLEEMAYHCRAVARARPRAHIVCDLPFMSYQVSPDRALESAGHLLKFGGAEAVKLEGGAELSPTVRRLVGAGIPVMGHIGLTPQSVHQMGGFKVQGRFRQRALALIEDARALEEAGVYSLVLEGLPAEVASAVTDAVGVPTIGIGAGAGTDGQVLVCYDLLGMYQQVRLKFVKEFGQVGEAIRAATERYVNEVRGGTFPAAEHSFKMAEGESLEDEQISGGAPGPETPSK